MLHVTGIVTTTLSYVYMNVHVAMFHSFTSNLDINNPPTFGASGGINADVQNKLP